MKLYLIRHAESANNALYSSNGNESERSSDPEITEIGHKQAARLGPFLAQNGTEPRQSRFNDNSASNFGITHLYCSLMTRSILTAEYISAEIRLPIFARTDLFEKGGIYQADASGKRTGLPGPGKEYFSNRFPKLNLPDNFRDDGWYNKPAEATAEFVSRMQNVVSDIRQQHEQTDDTVALVVHGDFIDQFINQLMGVERKAENYRSSWVANWVFHNTSISRIDFHDGSQSVVYLNRIEHLPADLVTW